MEMGEFDGVYCLVLLYLCSISSISGQVRLEPQNFNASEGSEAISFLCSAPVSSIFFFTANDKSIDQVVMQQRGIVQNTVNDSASRLTVRPLLVNNNLSIACFSLALMASTDGVLLVQGTLSAPPDAIIGSASSTGLKELSWNPPFTIDLSAQDPDILGYKLCFTLALPSHSGHINTLQCRITQSLTYSFTNVRLNLNFTVAALNPVGEGASSVVLHQACSGGVSMDIEVRDTELLGSADGNYTVSATIQISSPQTNCYDAYQLHLLSAPSSSSAAALLQTPVLLPVIQDQQTLRLSSQLSGVMTNTIYKTSITATTADEERTVVENITLSTYDVQSVSVELPGSGRVLVLCVFLAQSSSQGCRVTVCQTDSSMTCLTEAATRDGGSNLATVMFLGVAEEMYAITLVEDMEEDGSFSSISDLSIFNLVPFALATDSGGMATSDSTLDLTVGSQNPLAPDSQSDSNTGVVIGSVVGGVLVAILLVLVVLVVVFLCYKMKRKNFYTFKTATPKTKKPVNSEQRQEHLVGVASTNPSTNHRVEVLGGEGGDKACSGSGCYDNLETLGLDAPPRVPPKKSRGSRDVAMETATSPVLLSPPSGWEGPLENLSMEDIQEVHLSPPSPDCSSTAVEERTSVSPTPMKINLASMTNSQDSLLVQKPPTYAEVMHVTTPQSNRRPRDKTSVFYSEIRIDTSPTVSTRTDDTSSAGGSRPNSKEFQIRTSQVDETLTGYRV